MKYGETDQQVRQADTQAGKHADRQCNRVTHDLVRVCIGSLYWHQKLDFCPLNNKSCDPSRRTVLGSNPTGDAHV